MPHANKVTVRTRGHLGVAAATLAVSFSAAAACNKPVYLTFDTGHMGVAPLVAEVLQRHQVKATFFLANEKTLTGGTSLDELWAPWWRARASEGHVLASHSYDHVYWVADKDDGRFEVKASAGPNAGARQTWSAAQYCAELTRSSLRAESMTGQRNPHLFRAPGGKTSPALLRAAQACGFQHVGWSPAGFLGDELPSDRFPNAMLLSRALRNIRTGDILVAHLGIWSRQDPWAPAVLEPLLQGLQERGFCFAPLTQHPAYGSGRPLP